MKKFKRLVAKSLSIITALSLFTGCSSDNANTNTNNTSADDNKTLITIDDINIPFSVGKFYAYNTQASYEAYYLANGYVMDWSVKYTDTSTDVTEPSTLEGETVAADATIEDMVKADVLDRIKIFYTVAKYAKDNGITLDDADYKEIDQYVKDYLAGNAKVSAATGATAESLKSIYETESYYNKGCDLILKDENFTVNEEDIRQTHIYVFELYPDNIEFPEDTAKGILKRIQNGEDIKQISDIYGITVSEGNVGKDSTVGDNIKSTCLSLHDGGSAIAVEDGAYFVIYCIEENDEDATEIAKKDAISLQKSAKLKEFYDEYTKNMKITVDEELWKKITFNNSIFTEDDIKDLISETTTTGENATTGENTTTGANATTGANLSNSIVAPTK